MTPNEIADRLQAQQEEGSIALVLLDVVKRKNEVLKELQALEQELQERAKPLQTRLQLIDQEFASLVERL